MSVERTLAAAAAAIIAPESAGLPPVDATATAACLRALLDRLPRDQVRLLRIGVLALDAAAVLTAGRRFYRLPPERGRTLIRGFARAPLAPLRRLAAVLKMLTQMAYFAGPEAWPGVGYDGPWLGRIAVEPSPAPRLGATAAGERRR